MGWEEYKSLVLDGVEVFTTFLTEKGLDLVFGGIDLSIL